MSVRELTEAENGSNGLEIRDSRVLINMEDKKSEYHVGLPCVDLNSHPKHKTSDQAADRVTLSTPLHYTNGSHYTNGHIYTNGHDSDYSSESHSDFTQKLNGDVSSNLPNVASHVENTEKPLTDISEQLLSSSKIPMSRVNHCSDKTQTNGLSTLNNGETETAKTDSSHSQHRLSLELTIPAFYTGKHVFITGATGFIGKVFVEKILRDCPDIAGLYCLVRPKKGQTVEERLSELVDSRLFDNLRKEQPDFCSKLHPIQGDILLPNFGLSLEDCRMLEECVNIVFHSAATVRFDEPLRKAVEMNVLSVRKMLILARSFKNLEAFVHVSTAYANCDISYIEEKVYPPPVEPQKIIDVLGWMDDEMLELFTPKLIGEKPNTYTYTKQLAEHLLITEGADLPLAIVRPSIVGAAWKEPFPGWIDNYNGPSGIYIAAGKGILRWMKADGNAQADIVPVDLTVNTMIAVGWYTAVAKPKSAIIYHSTTGNANPFKWGEMEPIVNKLFKQVPLEQCFRRPNIAIVNNSFTEYWKVVSHLFPAFVYDVAYALIGRKPKMVKIYNKLHRSIDCLTFFTTNEWRWETRNLEMLRRQLTPEDMKTFYIDLQPLHWPTYIENYCLGAKKYLLNEDLARLPVARAHIRKLRIIRTLFNSAICVILWRVLIAKSQFARNLWFFIVNLVSKFVQFFRITSTIHK